LKGPFIPGNITCLKPDKPLHSNLERKWYNLRKRYFSQIIRHLKEVKRIYRTGISSKEVD